MTLPIDRYTQLGPGHFAAIVHNDIAITTDGVGTKAQLAWDLDQLETIGIDCVAMNVNDLLCVGAEPTVLVDYISIPDETKLHRVMEGFIEGAKQAHIDIPGGETAKMSHFDVAGTAIGKISPFSIEKNGVVLAGPILGDRIEVGDIMIGLSSSGIHANGISKARELLGDDPRLLTPTRIYEPLIFELLTYLPRSEVHGMVHITGGGTHNITRILPPGRNIIIEAPMPVPQIFLDMPEEERDETVFNLGLGFVIFVSPEYKSEAIGAMGEGQYIGYVT